MSAKTKKRRATIGFLFALRKDRLFLNNSDRFIKKDKLGAYLFRFYHFISTVEGILSPFG